MGTMVQGPTVGVQLFLNNASSSLGLDLTSVATSLTLAAGQGVLFPAISSPNFFLLTLTQGNGPETSWEIVKVTARTGDVLTIVRAQEGTTAVAWSVGSKAELRVTAAILAPAVAGGANGLLLGSDKTKLDATSNTNTGDETLATIKTKLGITTLSGSNTGDQTLPTLSSLAGQPLDADLTAIAALTGTTGLLKKTAANTWALDTAAYTTNTGTVTGVTGTSPVVSSGGTAPVISIPAATASVNGYMSSTYASKLDGITAGANNYTHPTNHPASIITQDASNRFVTDTEKATWNAKQAGDADLTAIAALTNTTGLLKKTAANTWSLDTTSYQPTLVSGTSIKTINGLSVLGAGDLAIKGIPVGTIITSAKYSEPLTLRNAYFGTNKIFGITYGNGFFLAVSPYGNSAATSADGITWTKFYTTIPAYCAAYGNGLFLLGGSGGAIVTSPDGITWTLQVSSFTNHTINCIIFAAGLFVAVASNAAIATSPDGVNWTQQVNGFNNAAIYSVTYGNGKFVAVGNSGYIATSPDGVNWTMQSSGFSTATIYSVCFGNGLFVASGAEGKLATSNDGVTWTQRTANLAGSTIIVVAYSNGVYVACGSGANIAMSLDGITWTKKINPLGNGFNFTSMAYSNDGLFVAGGSSGQIITFTEKSFNAFDDEVLLCNGASYFKSSYPELHDLFRSMSSIVPAGDVWVDATISGLSTSLEVIYENGLYVAVGSSGSIRTSVDGIAWTTRTNSTSYKGEFRSVAYGNGLFVAGGSSVVAVSADGVTWTTYPKVNDSFPVYEMIYAGGIFLGVAYNKIHYSADGTTWTANSVNTYGINGLAYGNGIYVIGGPYGMINTSTDGINWTYRTNIFDAATINNVSFGNGLFVAVGNSGALATSTDGINWTSRTSNFGSGSILKVKYINGLFVAVGASNIITSPDGITWTVKASISGTYTSVVYGGNYFLAFQDYGQAVISKEDALFTLPNITETHGTVVIKGK